MIAHFDTTSHRSPIRLTTDHSYRIRQSAATELDGDSTRCDMMLARTELYYDTNYCRPQSLKKIILVTGSLHLAVGRIVLAHVCRRLTLYQPL